MSEKCSALVRRPGRLPRTCNNAAKTETPNGWRCGIHSPDTVARRREKTEQRYSEIRAKWNLHNRREERRDACTRAIDAIGGDPAMVGELVAALREIVRIDDEDAVGLRAADGCDLSIALRAARALLARIQPKDSSNG